MLERIRNIICEFVDIDPESITPETNIRTDLGLNSLELVNLAVEIEEEFDVEIATEDAESIVTVQDAVDQIKNALS